jgi:hypothetical protein
MRFFDLKTHKATIKAALRFMELLKKQWPDWEGELKFARYSGRKPFLPSDSSACS